MVRPTKRGDGRDLVTKWFLPYLDGSRPWLDPDNFPKRSADPNGYEVRSGKGKGKVEVLEGESELLERIRQRPFADWMGLPGRDHLLPSALASKPPSDEVNALRRRRHLHSLRRNGLYLILGLSYLAYDLIAGEGRVAFLIVIGLFLIVARPMMEALIGVRETQKSVSPELRAQRQAEWILFLGWLETRPARRIKVGLWILVGIFVIQVLKSPEGILTALLLAPLFEPAALIPDRVNEGEWWRLLTAGFLHGFVIHIWFNGTALYDLGRILAAILRPGVLAFVFLVSVLVGSIASWLLPPDSISVGASGGILGVLGFLAVLTWRKSTRLPQALRLRVGFSIGLITLLGVLGAQLIDNAAHGGGFLAGVILALLLPRSARIWNAGTSPWWRWVGGLSALVLAAGAIKAIYELLTH